MSDDCGSRLRAVRNELKMTQKALASAVGMSERGWQELEKGTNLPRGETLQQLAAMGYDPTWILTGVGLMHLSPTPPTSTLDDWLMNELGKIVVREHRAAKETLPPEKVAPEAGNLYNELLGMVRDVSDRRTVEAMLPLLAENLRNRLREAAAAPGSGKREAS